MLFTLLFSCTVDWIEPNDFSLTYKNSETAKDQNGQSNSEASNQGISESNDNTQTEETPSSNPIQDENPEPSAENPSEQEDSEQPEQENSEPSSQPSSEPSLEEDPTNDSEIFDDLLFDGSWSILDPVILTENCNVNAWSSIVDIYDLVPSEFDITDVSNTGFSMNLLNASILCSIENEVFTCDTYESIIQVPNFDAFGEVLFLYEGILQSSSSFGMNLEIDIYNCMGTDCAILAFLVPYPCQIIMEGNAEFIQ